MVTCTRPGDFKLNISWIRFYLRATFEISTTGMSTETTHTVPCNCRTGIYYFASKETCVINVILT